MFQSDRRTTKRLSPRCFLIRGSHPWLTILLLPGFWACNIVLSEENSIGFTKVLLGIRGFYLVFSRFLLFLQVFTRF